MTSAVPMTRARAVLASPSTAPAVFLLAVVLIGLASTPSLLSSTNIASTLVQLTPLAAMAIVAATAMHGGVVDISIASVFGLGGMVFARTLEIYNSVGLATVAGAVAGLLAGAANAVISVRFRVEPLIATLGMYVAARGLVRVVGSGQSVGAYRPSLSYALTTTVWLLPVIFLAAVVVAVLVGLGIKRTRYGRHLVAVGGDETAARRAGIPASRIRWHLFLATGCVAALAGVLQCAIDGSAAVNLGEGLELQVYAALLIAGYRITGGGKGNPVSGLVALGALMLLIDIFGLHGLPLPLHDVILGVALLAAMVLEILRDRRGTHALRTAFRSGLAQEGRA